MNIVKFPMVNLTLKINRRAFNIGGVSIYWYAIFITLAMIIAIIIYKKRDGLYGIKFTDVIDLATVLIPISIICARIYYVIFKLEDYTQNPISILNLKAGGLAIYGGMIGGLITCIVFSKKNKIELLNLLDFLVPALALRSINWKMGKFCKCRSLRNKNNITLENGNI